MEPADKERIERIHLRFERDFLPKYGNLWRSMIERRGAEMGRTKPTAKVREPTPVRNDVYERGEIISESSFKNEQTNFLDAIQRGKPMLIRVPNHKSGSDCDCVDCLPPILEWENVRIQKATEDDQYFSDRDDDPSTDSIQKSETSSGDDGPVESVASNKSPSTPLPKDLYAQFGRLSFGNRTSKNKENNSKDHHYQQQEDDNKENKIIPGISVWSAEYDNEHKVQESTSPLRKRDLNNKDLRKNQEPESCFIERTEEFNQGERKEESDEGGSSVSSASTPINFDISHILEPTPAKAKDNQKNENEDPAMDVVGTLLSPEQNPRFSPGSSTCDDDDDSFKDAKQSESESEVDSESSASTAINFDISHILKSPIYKEEGISDNVISEPVSNQKPPVKENNIVSSGVGADNVIELLEDTTDEDDQTFGGRILYPQSPVDAGTSGVLIDTTDESDNESTKPRRRQPPRQRRALAPRYFMESSEEEENEWGGGESNSEASFVSPDELDDEDHGRRKSRSGVDWQISKGRTVNGTSQNTFEDENRNPNPRGKNAFKKQRETLSTQYFQEFNRFAFDDQLSSVKVVWSNKLRTTAGVTRLKRTIKDFTPGVSPVRSASIELSTKVLDDPERLRSTLLHEMVHAVAWLVDGVSKPPHGPCFKKWAKIAMRRIPDVSVTTTHDYQIQYKYAWACTSPGCSFLVQRHSRSVDVKRHCCGRCKGRLVEVEVPENSSSGGGKSLVDRTPRKRAQPSGYNLFVKEHSKSVRDRLMRQERARGVQDPKVSQPLVMKECARLWQEHKQKSKSIH